MKAVPLLMAGLLLVASAAVARPQPPAELAEQARDVLHQHCFACHGKDPKKPKGKLNLFDRGQLLDGQRKIVVPKAAGESELIKRIEDAESPMPPAPRPSLSAAEKDILRRWVAAGASAWAAPPTATPALAGQVKELFRSRCLECHGGSKTQAGVQVLDHAGLLAKKKVVPGQPEASLLFQLISARDESVMPPAGQPALNASEIDLVRQWIAAGAPAFPADVAVQTAKGQDPALKDVVGVEHIFKKVLEHVRTLKAEDRPFVRFLSINHLAAAGATRQELDLHRDALAKAINHLSWERTLAVLRPIDAPANTVFAVDLRELGWHRQPFERLQAGQSAGRSRVNLYDLALLEYPYATIYEDSETYDRLVEEFLAPAGQVRPIPYVRADWFVSIATQPPLYDDFLQLPLNLAELESRLGVESQANLDNAIAKRAGMIVSGVSKNNRVVERHPAKHGAYWKSYDFRSSKGQENMFKDPIRLNASGGEMIFNLPNGLQGYYVCDAKGIRVDAAPTDIVTDKFAEDKVVRNGLACMRCHDQGMKSFLDVVRPAVERLPGSPGFDKRQVLLLYPEQPVMDKYLQEDSDRFRTALATLLGRPPAGEPLVPVSRRFLDAPIALSTASGELGLAEPGSLAALFRAPQFAGLGLVPLGAEGVIRRDMWEDYHDQVVRQLGLGVPMVPLDGNTRRDYQTPLAGIDVELKTNKKNNLFEPNDKLEIIVVNKSKTDVFIELVGTSSKGKKVMLTDVIALKAGAEYKKGPITIQGGLGKEQITLFACGSKFPAGYVLRGKDVADRAVHDFYDLRRDGARRKLAFDASRMVKKTIEIETR